MITSEQMQINPNQLQPTAINPNAFSNMNTIQGVYGSPVPNTFNRTVGTADQSMGQNINPMQTGVVPQYPAQAVPTTF